MRRLVFAVIGLLLATAGAYAVAVRLYTQPGPLGAARSFVVPRGSSAAIADALASGGVIAHRMVFRLAALATAAQGPLRAGELAFPAHASVAQVLAVLRFAPPVQHRLTIPEGLTAAQIARLLADASGLTGDVTVPAEGAVLPDTYQYQLGTPRDAILARAERAMARATASAWAGRDPGVKLASAQAALILASIVEREARLPAERGMIARVFLNRLAIGMRLQADPTALYGASGGLGQLNRALLTADLARVDGYNTYVVPALPAGPICAPGTAAISAVLHPAAGNALYFVSDGAGGHMFAATLAAHTENVRRWRGRN